MNDMNTKHDTQKPETRRPQFRAVPNARGGWSIRTAGINVGNYPTKVDAERIIALNGGNEK